MTPDTTAQSKLAQVRRSVRTMAALPGVPSVFILVVSVVLLAVIFGLAEFVVRTTYVMPDAVFFGVPLACLAIVGISSLRIQALRAEDSSRRRLREWPLAVALVGTFLVMFFFRDHYRGDYAPMRGKLAPDGAAVTSISWHKESGRYFERLNKRFDIELSESQYREAFRMHRRGMLIAPITFGALAALLALANVVLERMRSRQRPP